MKDEIQQSCNDLINGEDSVESFQKIGYSDNMDKFSIYVDKSKFTGMDTINAMAFYLSSTALQKY